MARPGVEMLVILGGNPVYTAPADLKFADHLAKVPLRIHLGLYQDETAALCDWHIPEAHYLESWSDARAYDGTASVIQPLIAPLFGGRSASCWRRSSRPNEADWKSSESTGRWRRQQKPTESGTSSNSGNGRYRKAIIADPKVAPQVPNPDGWAERCG